MCKGVCVYVRVSMCEDVCTCIHEIHTWVDR